MPSDKLEMTHRRDRILLKTFKKYFEMLIFQEGHAWCMDVPEERRKMTELASNVLINTIETEDALLVAGENEIYIHCDCKRGVLLRHVGGQYQDSYIGRCVCKKGWILKKLAK